MLRFGKNLLALLLCAFLIIVVFMLSKVFMPFGLVCVLVFLFSTCIYIPVYAAYPKIKEVMLDPYYEKHPDEKPYGWDGVFGTNERSEISTDDLVPPGDT